MPDPITIQPKFSLGDECYYIGDHKIVKAHIFAMEIIYFNEERAKDKPEIGITYQVQPEDEDSYYEWVEEEELFKTKDRVKELDNAQKA
jgi:hypothetical protein